MLVFAEDGKPEKPDRNRRSKARTSNILYQHMAQSLHRTQATLVGGELSRHCAIPASHLVNFSAVHFFQHTVSNKRKISTKTLRGKYEGLKKNESGCPKNNIAADWVSPITNCFLTSIATLISLLLLLAAKNRSIPLLVSSPLMRHLRCFSSCVVRTYIPTLVPVTTAVCSETSD